MYGINVVEWRSVDELRNTNDEDGDDNDNDPDVNDDDGDNDDDDDDDDGDDDVFVGAMFDVLFWRLDLQVECVS